MLSLIRAPRIYSAAITRWSLPNACVRLASTETNLPSKSPEDKLAEEKAKYVALLANDLPKPYDGPERDHVNFPRWERRVEPGVIRHGFIPQEWLDFFYKKTGVTGPYVFGAGLITFLLSKEWYVLEEETSTAVTLFILTYVAMKKLGPPLRKYCEKAQQEDIQEKEDWRKKHLEALQKQYDVEKKNQWYQGNLPILMQAKRENVQIQLEIEYRRRRMLVYEALKKRLDYFVEMDSTRKKLQQKHMVDWIVQNVIKSITPQQEKEALAKCVADLKSLSARVA